MVATRFAVPMAVCLPNPQPFRSSLILAMLFFLLSHNYRLLRRRRRGNPHEPLSERAEKDIQSEIDRQYEQFVATVARNRKADAEKIVATQAGVYWSENAVPLLADAVGTLGDAMNARRQL